jgi:ribosomal protein S18 acetylase RimI-like enzyme
LSKVLVKVDYSNPQQGRDLLALLQEYAMDPKGGGQPLSDHVKDNLLQHLSHTPKAFSVICYVNEQPAGLANCFEGFSTFACKPLVNIHDLAVSKEHRGLGISQALLSKVEEIASERGCCKITLEVLDGNQVAKNAYRKFGFAGYELKPENGQAIFWQKLLTT